jgi:hypothetical protein
MRFPLMNKSEHNIANACRRYLINRLAHKYEVMYGDFQVSLGSFHRDMSYIDFKDAITVRRSDATQQSYQLIHLLVEVYSNIVYTAIFASHGKAAQGGNGRSVKVRDIMVNAAEPNFGGLFDDVSSAIEKTWLLDL